MLPTIGIVEGWQGDPSFFNWPALSLALVDNIVQDFPLCNKSFNQSYSGNDL